jgi:DNA ligase-1
MLPMLAIATNLDDIEKKRMGYHLEAKLDGWRCIATKEGNQVHLTSRTGKPFTMKVPHIVAQLQEIPFDFVIDGELGYLDHTKTERPVVFDYNKGARVLGSGETVARMKQKRIYDETGEHISFVVFDILSMDDVDFAADVALTIEQPYSERRAELSEFFLYVHHHRVRDVYQSEAFSWYTIDELLEYYNEIVSYGGEGVMLKDPNSLYVPGKRPANTWYKLKADETIDVVIMKDYKPGKGKYEGQVGAIMVGAHGPDPLLGYQDNLMFVAYVSGMTDEVRRELTDHWDMYVNRVVEIKHFGKVGLESGGLRHPQFVRFRNDKNPYDCLLSDI